MTSIALGVFIVFIVYVVIWSMRNDGAKSLRDQTGIIRMRVPKGAGTEKPDDPAAGKRSDPRAGRSPREQSNATSSAVTKGKGRQHQATRTSGTPRPPKGRRSI